MQGRVKAVGRWFAEVPAGRRSKWAVLGVWIVIFIAIGPLAGKFEDAQENDPADYLPANAESVKAIDELEEFPSGDISEAITVFSRDDGLTEADRQAIDEIQAAINSDPPEGVGETGPPIYSEDASSALLITPITTEDNSNEAGDLIVDATDDIKAELEDLPSGLEAKVTGPAGFSADAIEVFDSIDGTLLYATAALVLVLLIIIYRSPIFWLIPFFSVIMAELTSRGIGYLLADAGVTVTGQSGGILPVLVFGAGTDYGLLLVSRYREELRSHEDKHEAVRIAMRKAGPAIVASGLTVMAALLTLSIAEVTSTAGLGPIGAMGVGLAMVSMLTILPALLAITGRRAFWPFIPRVGSEGVDESSRPLEPGRRLGRARATAGLDRDHGPAPGALPRADPTQQRPDQRQRLPQRRRLGRGPEADRGELPRRGQRPDRHRRHRRGEAGRRPRPRSPRRRGWRRSARRRSRARPASSSRRPWTRTRTAPPDSTWCRGFETPLTPRAATASSSVARPPRNTTFANRRHATTGSSCRSRSCW